MGTLIKIEKVKNENVGQPKAQGGRLVRVGTRSAPSFLGTAPVKAERQAQEPEGQTVRAGSFGGSGGGKRYAGGFTGKRESGPADWGKIAGGTALLGLDEIAQAGGAALSMAEGLVTKPLGYVLGDPELYKKGLFHTLNEGVKRETEANQEKYHQEFAKAGKAGELIEKFGPATVAALPQAALAYLTAGQSLLAQQTTGALTAASTAAQAAGRGAKIARTVTAALKATGANPSFQYSLINTIGGEYEQAKADGADDLHAYTYAALAGLMNSAVEVGGGIDVLPEVGKSGIRQWVDTMLDEGKEEVIQGAISQLAQAAVYGKDNPLFSMTDQEAVINPGRAAEEFAGGAVVGGILGGGQIAVNKALGRPTAEGDTGIPPETETPATGRETANGGAVNYKEESTPSVPYGSAMAKPSALRPKRTEPVPSNTTVPQPAGAVNRAAEQYTSRLLRRGVGQVQAEQMGQWLALEESGEALTAMQEQMIQDEPEAAALREVLRWRREKTKEPPTRASSPEDPAVQSENTGGSINTVSQEVGTVNKKAPPATVDETGTSPDHTSETSGRPALSNATVPQEVEAVNRAAEPGYHGGATAGIMTVYEAAMLDRLGKAAGVAIQAAPPTGDGRQGWYQNGRVYIAEDAQDPVLTVARHEITHRLQETAPEQYRAFRDYAAEVLERRGGVQEQIDAITRLYAHHGQELTAEEALDELAADFAGELLTDEAAIRRMAGENRTLAQRIRDAIHDLLRRVRAALGGEETRTLERAARLWDRALEASRGAEGAGDGGTRYSLRTFENGQRYVDVEADQNLFDGLSLNEMDDVAKHLISEKFSGKIIGIDNRAFVNNQTAREYVHPAKNIFGEVREAKMRASAELDNLLDAGTNFRTEADGKDGHIHPDVIGGFDYFDVVFKVGDQYYSGVINIKNNQKGKLLKDVTKIRNITQDITSSYGENPPSGFLRDASINSIPQDSTKGKGELSTQIKGKSQARQTENPLPGAGRNTATDFNNSIPQDRGESKGELSANGWLNASESYDTIETNQPNKGESGNERYQTREEDQEAFRGRCVQAGYQVEETGETAYGYRPVHLRSAQQNARSVQEELSRLGVPSFIHDGEIEANRDGRTYRHATGEAATLDKSVVGISNTVSLPARNVAGHEAFHYWSKGVQGREFTELLLDNLDFSSEDVRYYASIVQEDHFGGKIDLSDDIQRARYLEELCAYLSGDIHEGAHEAELRQMLRDYDEVKAAWESLKTKEAGITPSPAASIKEGLVLGTPASRVSVADIASLVKDDSGSLVKYLPDSMLSADQRAAKRAALAAREEKLGDMRYEYAVERGELASAEDMLRQKAALRGYTGRGQVYQNAVGNAKETGVTYDDNGTLIPLSERYDPNNADTRYSVKGAMDLEKQVELLQRQNARLKEQMKRTDVPRANHQAVARQARELLSQYSSEYDKGRLTTRLEGLYEDMAAKGGSVWEQDHAPSWEELRQSARKLAEDILAESWENVNSLTAEYRDFQKELRGRAVTLSPQYRADLESVGGYEDFRKRYFGRLRLANQGTPVDVLYEELAVRWPELLPDDIVNPADQLLRMADMLDEMAPVMGNAYEADMDRTAEYLAGEILERFYDTPQEAPTFADRAARQREKQRLKDREVFQDRMNRQRFATDQKLKEQRLKDREAFQEKYRSQRERRERDIKALKEKHRQQNRERTERQTDAQWRETIRRGTARLGRKLTRPTNSSHIPEKLRGTVLNFLRSIDTSSQFEYVFGTDAKYHRVAAGSALGAEPATRTEAARALQASYEKLAAEGGITVDPDMKNYLDLLSDMGNIPLDEMSHDQLDTVRRVLRVIEHTVSEADELLQESKFQTVSDMARALREENGGRKDRRNYVGPLGAADKLMNLDMLTPETFLHRLGTAGEDLYRQMRLADDKKTAILKEATDRGRELVKESGVDFAKADKEIHTFDLEDGELTLSTSQIMELYALSHRQQALEHIYIGGLLSRGNTGRFGLKLEKPRAVKVSPIDVANILNTLTPKQKALMDGLQSYLSGDLARHGNQASLQVYGYEKFKERNYWPIRVSQEQVGSNPAQKAAARTIPGFGMTKALTEHASNAVELRSAADTFSDHAVQMATYAAWLGTSENVTRLMNHTYAADGGGWKPGEGRSRDGTVRELLRQVYGEGGAEYLEKLLGDVANGTKAARDTNFSVGKMTSAFKASAVGGNLRVILQQPTAILRAAEMMDPKYLMMGMARRGGWKKALEHSPIAQWKDWGYFEMDTGKSVREIMLGTEGALNKAQSAMMAPAGWADGVAWGALWNAVEAETRAEHKELGENTQAFYDHCGKRFGEIIDRTQVVDTVLHRSQAMRSQSELTKMATSFMSEPTKIYNEIARGVYDYTRAENREGRIKAAKGLGRKAFALSLSFAVNAIAQSLPDVWRDKEREKSFWGRFGENWVENFLDNYNLVGYVPFLKDGLSVVQGYDVGRMDMEVFSDIVSAAVQVQKAAAGEGKVTLGYASLELALQACRALGLPLANIKRDIVGIASNGLLDLGLYEQVYELDKLMYREEDDQGRFVADLYRAMNGDDADYRAIYRDLEETMETLYPGEGGEKLKAAMEDRMKTELGVNRATSLPARYSAPGEDPAFDRLIREGQSAGGWIRALPEGAAELAGSLDAMEDSKTMDRLLAIGDSPWSEAVKEDAMEVNLTGKGLERYRAARRAGVSTYAYTDFLDRAYRAARKRTGKDSASLSQEDVYSALERAELTDRQRTAIWNGYGWKKESPWG